MFERRALGMSIRIPAGHVEIIEHASLFDKLRGDLEGKLGQQPRDHMSPRFLLEREMQGLDGLFGRLLRREACPLVPAVALGCARLLQISLGLSKPVLCALCHESRSLYDSGSTNTNSSVRTKSRILHAAPVLV